MSCCPHKSCFMIYWLILSISSARSKLPGKGKILKGKGKQKKLPHFPMEWHVHVQRLHHSIWWTTVHANWSAKMFDVRATTMASSSMQSTCTPTCIRYAHYAYSCTHYTWLVLQWHWDDFSVCCLHITSHPHVLVQILFIYVHTHGPTLYRAPFVNSHHIDVHSPFTALII